MGRFRTLKNSFLGGQISRDAVGRSDLPQYAHSCELMQNQIPLLSGGSYRRPGSIFQDYATADVATPTRSGGVSTVASSPPRLFPFVSSNRMAFAVLIGVSRNPALSGTVPIGGAYLSYYRATGNGNSTFSSGVVENVFPYRCKSVNPNGSGTLQDIYTRQGGPGAVANSGNTTVPPASSVHAIVDIADSLQSYDDDVWSVQFCQANDVMFLTHPDYPPQVIYLQSDNSLNALPWNAALTGLQAAQSVPYLNQNSTTVSLALNTATNTLTASSALFDTLHGPRVTNNAALPYVGTDGAIFAIAVGEGAAMTGNNTDSGIIFCRVTGVTNSTTAAVSVLNGIPSRYVSGTASTAWWESAWSNFRGWPRACAIFKQRLALAATAHQPNAIWFTASASFGAPNPTLLTYSKFSALGDGPNQGIKAGAAGVLANGQNYSTPQNWVYSPVDDAQGDGQSTGPLGSQPFRISLATTSLDAIQYLSPDQQLFIGTAEQEWVCAGVNGGFDVANSVCSIQSHYGSDFVQAVRIGYELMFVMQNRSEIRAYQYNYFDQSFFGEPVQLFFDEYPYAESQGASTYANPYSGRRKYRALDWDASRSSLWCVDTAGSLFGIVRDRKLQVTSWHTHQIGGYDVTHGSGQNQNTNLSAGNNYTDSGYYLCDGSVVSAASVPNPLSGIRDLWLVVKRSYQGGSNTIWSVERIVGGNTTMQTAFSSIAPGNAQEPLYLDCAYLLTDNLNSANFNYTVGAFLQGQTLQGTYYSKTWGLFAITTTAAASSVGGITLQNNLPPDYGSTTLHTMVVGLMYNSVLQPVRLDPPSQVGTSQGAIKRPAKAYVRFFKTLMCKIGRPPNLNSGYFAAAANLEVVKFGPNPSGPGYSPEIFTGDKEVFLPNGFDRDGYLYIVQDQPLPFTVVSISVEGVEYEQ